MIDTILEGDCLELLPSLPDDSIDAVCTDPPYELTSSKSAKKGFMGNAWDGSGIAYNTDMWAGCLRVLKPGGHLLAFGGDRTHHRMFCAIEDAGFEIRHTVVWTYGSGFPKSLDISKKLDQMAGMEREVVGVREEYAARANKKPHSNNSTVDGFAHPGEIGQITAPATPAAQTWAGWGSALKPAAEFICLARKPLAESTIAANVLRWGCGGLNIDGCRVGTRTENESGWSKTGSKASENRSMTGANYERAPKDEIGLGRFPANLIHDGSPEVLAEFAKAGERKSGKGIKTKSGSLIGNGNTHGKQISSYDNPGIGGDSGSAARFFQACPFTEEDIPAFLYYAKASRSEREKGLDGIISTNGVIQNTSGRRFNPICNNTGKRIQICDCGNCEWDKSSNPSVHNSHPTVKPLSLMRYLCRLITPSGGLILDPFAGSGTTCLAAKQEGFRFIGIEKEPEYAEIARRRVASVDLALHHKPLTAFS